jgi:TolA-binding protein
MDKRQEIVKAIESGEFSRIQISPTARGKYAGLLVKGRSVSERAVEGMYKNLLALRKDRLQKMPTVTEQITENHAVITERLQNENVELQNRLQKAQEEIVRLQNELQKSVATVTEQITEKRKGENVLGFTLAFAKGYWYASKRTNGCNITVYVGKDKANAEARIKKWLDAKNDSSSVLQPGMDKKTRS